MIVGSVGGGILVGMTSALVTWMAGHPPSVILMAYGMVGSMGTLAVAAVSSLYARDQV